MNYEEFLQKIEKSVREKLKRTANIQTHHVIKNNGLELDGLIIFTEDRSISPTIYLDVYYERFRDGESIDEIVNDIIDVYEVYSDIYSKKEYENRRLELENFEFWKKKIIFRLVNFEKNKKLLKEIPYIPFLDLAITFHCIITQEDKGISSTRVTNEFMKLWGITVLDIMDYSIENTQQLFPVSLRSMTEVIQEVVENNFDETENETFQSELRNKNMQIYVLSNESGLNGAASMLYPEVMNQIALEWNCDLVILPSSIHEVIIIPYYLTICKSDLEAMVSEINQRNIPDMEILSDHVYTYHRETKKIYI